MTSVGSEALPVGQKTFPFPSRSCQKACPACSIPTVSARNALFHLIMQKAHGYSEEEAHCGDHPNTLGHRCETLSSADSTSAAVGRANQPFIAPRFTAVQCKQTPIGAGAGGSGLADQQCAPLCRYFGDLVIASLQDQAYAALTVPEEHMQYSPPFEGLTGIPPPVLEDYGDYDSECFIGELLPQVVVPELSEVSTRRRSAWQGARRAMLGGTFTVPLFCQQSRAYGHRHASNVMAAVHASSMHMQGFPLEMHACVFRRAGSLWMRAYPVGSQSWASAPCSPVPSLCSRQAPHRWHTFTHAVVLVYLQADGDGVRRSTPRRQWSTLTARSCWLWPTW